MPTRRAKIKTMSTFTTGRNWENSGLFQIFYLLISSPPGTQVNVNASPSHLCPPWSLHIVGPFLTSSIRTLSLISIHSLVLLLHHFGTYIAHTQYPLLVLLHNCLSSLTFPISSWGYLLCTCKYFSVYLSASSGIQFVVFLRIYSSCVSVFPYGHSLSLGKVSHLG